MLLHLVQTAIKTQQTAVQVRYCKATDKHIRTLIYKLSNKYMNYVPTYVKTVILNNKMIYF